MSRHPKRPPSTVAARLHALEARLTLLEREDDDNQGLIQVEERLRNHEQRLMNIDRWLDRSHEPWLMRLDEEILATRTFVQALSKLPRELNTHCRGIRATVGPQSTLVIAFSGLQEVFGWWHRLQSMGFGVIHLIDSRERWYLDGCDGSSSPVDMVERVNQLTSKIPHSRIVTLGQSMGGYAALRFAKDLGASACIAFSPQTHHMSDSIEAGRLQRPPEDTLDIRPYLSSSDVETHILVSASERDNPRETYWWNDHGHLDGLSNNPNLSVHTSDTHNHILTVDVARAGRMNMILRLLLLNDEGLVQKSADLKKLLQLRPAEAASGP